MKDKYYQARVYYSDTDSGGVVYHARYLNFFEKARVEFLRNYGISLSSLDKNLQILFIVSKASIEYLKPARLEDELFIFSEVKQVKNVSMIFDQYIRLNSPNGDIICKIEVKLGCVNSTTLRPSPMPVELKNKWS